MEDEGKGLSESERRTRGLRTSFRPTTGFFLSTGEYLQQVWDLSEALHSELCVRGQLISLKYVRGDGCGDRTGQDLEGGKISFKWVSDDCAG